MFQKITIQDLGPLEDASVRLSPTGTTTVTARSEAGKSTLLTALMVATTGRDEHGHTLDVAHIRDGAAVMSAEVTTAAGTRLRRTVDREGNKDRFHNGIRVRTESDWRDTIRAIGTKVRGDGREYDAARLVACPMEWHDLLRGSSRGRAFRDIIAPDDPESFRAAVVEAMAEAGHELADTDHLKLKAAENHRTETKRRRDVAHGSLEQAQRSAVALAERAPETVDPAAVERAHDVLARAKAWADHDAAAREHARAVQAAGQAEIRLLSWKRRLAQLDEELAAAEADVPADAPTASEVEEAQEQLDAATWARSLAQRERDAIPKPSAPNEQRAADEARAAMARVNGELAEARKHEHDDNGPCPTCGHAGYDWKARIAELVEESKAALVVYDKASEELQAALDAAARAYDEAVAKADEDLARASELARVARETWAAKSQAAQVAQRASDRVLALKQTRETQAANEPPPVPEVGDAPVPPDVERPDPAAPTAARLTLEQAQREQGAVAEHARQVEAARARIGEAEQNVARWEAAVARAEALVAAVRGAPGRLFDAGVARMGDLHGVTLRLDDDGVPVVLVDGRPWHCASHGRQIAADAAIRHGLRRRFGMTWFPLFIDDAQAWTGDFDSIPGPKVVLRTDRAAEGLVVTHEEPAKAGDVVAA